MTKKNIVHILCFLLTVVTLSFAISMPISASNDGVPYKSYTYWQGYSKNKPKAMKEMYSVKQTLEFGAESELQHICFDENENLYVLDSSCSSVIILDENYIIKEKVTASSFNGETIDFSQAEGIYVNQNGKIFVADTANQRIIVFGLDRKIEKIITRPKSLLLPDDFNFAPIKVVEDKQKFLYVLCDGSFYGAMKFSPEYDFLGFFGANNVRVSVISAIGNFFKEIVTTAEKQMNDVQKLPFTFLNFCIDDEGFIFTTTASPDTSQGGQVRRLGPGGVNILKHKFNFKTVSGDNFRFGDIIGVKNSENITRGNRFSAIASAGKFFYLLDSISGRIFVYDFECNLINVFSGGYGSGDQKGTFKTPTSIAVNRNGDILVSDFEKKNITVFGITDYGKTVMTADNLAMKGEYDKAEKYWETVITQDENNQMAYIAIGKAAMMRKDYDTAMKYAKLGLDQETYARAHSKVFTAKLKNNFLWLFLVALILVGTLSAAIVITTKKNVVLIKNPVINTAFSSALHPKASFLNVTEKNLGSVVIATILLILFFITRTAGDIYPGFMYVVLDNDFYNVTYTFLGTVVLILLWVVVNWCVCVLFEGKGKIKQIYITTCYSLIPLILYSVLYIILSYFVTPSSVSFLSLISNVCNIYFIVMMLVAVMTVHEFDFKHTVLTSLLTVLGMAIAGFMIFMVLTLAQDFLSFILSIIQEVLLR